MRADNSISFRINTDKKDEYRKAAALDDCTLTAWLMKLADERIKEQNKND